MNTHSNAKIHVCTPAEAMAGQGRREGKQRSKLHERKVKRARISFVQRLYGFEPCCSRSFCSGSRGWVLGFGGTSFRLGEVLRLGA